MVCVERLRADQWELQKRMRCSALEKCPAAFSTTLESALQKTDDEWRQLIAERASAENSLSFFAYYSDEPAGMAACILDPEDKNAAELVSVWVEPAFRRYGVGAALMDFPLPWLRERKISILRAGVTSTNESAKRFYVACGFRDTGIELPFPNNPNRTQIIMEKTL